MIREPADLTTGFHFLQTLQGKDHVDVLFRVPVIVVGVVDLESISPGVAFYRIQAMIVARGRIEGRGSDLRHATGDQHRHGAFGQRLVESMQGGIVVLRPPVGG